MRALLGLVLMLLAGPALAQTPGDIVTMPDTATATWRAQITAGGAPVAAVGLADCAAVPTVQADLESVVVLPSPATGVIVGGSVSFDPAAGEACYRAYAVGTGGLLSASSPNARRVLLRPLAVVFVE